MKLPKPIPVLTKGISWTLIFLIRGLRPLLGPTQCKFFITCTPYAVDKLKTESLPRALTHIMLRLLCCSPFYSLIPVKIRTIVS